MTRGILAEIIKLNMERRGLNYRKIEKLINMPRALVEDIVNGGESINLLWRDGKPSPMFYRLVGVLALDTVDIIKLKTILSDVCATSGADTRHTYPSDSATSSGMGDKR